ncbi:hypothetical protein NX05_22860 [Xanthomonas vasicola]|nr:hypothetical protein NX05_22860 [Xanthomonas vasicola]
MPWSSCRCCMRMRHGLEQQRRLTNLGELAMTASALLPGLPTLLLVGNALAEAAAGCDDRYGTMAAQAVG